MDSTIVVITAAIGMPVTALATWFCITIARIHKELPGGFEGIHFEA
jgi:hypothetical protein